jgi:hypothetical protein
MQGAPLKVAAHPTVLRIVNAEGTDAKEPEAFAPLVVAVASKAPWMESGGGLVPVVAATIDEVEPTGNVERDAPHDQLAFALAQTPPPDKTRKVKSGKS